MSFRIADLGSLSEAPKTFVDIDGALPAIDPAGFDLLLTNVPEAPAPWVSVRDLQQAQQRVSRAVSRNPLAATMVLGLLRQSGHLPLEAALAMESLAYSSLLGGDEFRRWLALRPPQPIRATPAEPLEYARAGDAVILTMVDPVSRNAYSAVMRDALAEALDACLDDASLASVELRGDPRVFCSGGQLSEFGTARDLVQAHLIRTTQSATARLLRLGSCSRATVEGAAVGSGAEISAAVHRLVAGPRAWFQLPELAMGLIPGAGGTVSIPRRIGRHRAAWLMLTGARLPARRALAWGLVDAMAPE
ncbi:enoyl-CoA hydratase/isomerase family protein [Aquibium microcysteis]|uniref:enoyl-CoA hydratase/isomerase family protein n=1 Tax=Aquibium microcysteis TaxID=675281 RepID=UPI00165D157E|nr:enoyl-CoA hydratase/isomerase family protein [Aquibium microcysteis]